MYAKFYKMLKMGLPRGAVEQKMLAEGLDPAVLEGGGDGGNGATRAGALETADGKPWTGRSKQPTTSAASSPPRPAMGGGGMGGLLAGIKQGGGGLKKASDRPKEDPKPAAPLTGMAAMMAEISKGKKLHKVTDEELKQGELDKPAAAPTGLMGAMAAALDKKFGNAGNSDSDSDSSDDDGAWSASGSESD